MLVIVGSAYDANARQLVARWKSRRATLLTCEDLSSPGWNFQPHARSSKAVLSGQIVLSSRISGILTRRAAIFPQERSRIAIEDRDYVAAEMNAFLLAWLAAQTCPILNRPSASNLSGPNWRTEQWVHVASRLGITVQAHRRFVPHREHEPSARSAVEITVVGDRCFGTSSGKLAASARALANAAGVHLLSVHFDEDERFLLADQTPLLADGEVAEAVGDYLGGIQ